MKSGQTANAVPCHLNQGGCSSRKSSNKNVQIIIMVAVVIIVIVVIVVVVVVGVVSSWPWRPSSSLRSRSLR